MIRWIKSVIGYIKYGLYIEYADERAEKAFDSLLRGCLKDIENILKSCIIGPNWSTGYHLPEMSSEERNLLSKFLEAHLTVKGYVCDYSPNGAYLRISSKAYSKLIVKLEGKAIYTPPDIDNSGYYL